MALSDDGGPELHPVASFDTVFVTEYPKMVALAAAVSGSRPHAEDIAQEAMSRLDRNWAKVQRFGKPGAWVRRVTINLALSQRRKLVAEAKAVLRLGRAEPALPPTPPEDAPVWRVAAELPSNSAPRWR